MTRDIIINGDIAIVPLTKGYSAVIDAADAPIVSQWNWCALTSERRRAIYAFRISQRGGKQTSVLMHRLIMSAENGNFVDHIDGNGLNNQRSNLRFCTFAQNVRNQGARKDTTSGVRGVSWDMRAGKWKAEIWLDGKNKFLGYFDSKALAIAVRNDASIHHFGEFARVQ